MKGNINEYFESYTSLFISVHVKQRDITVNCLKHDRRITFIGHYLKTVHSARLKICLAKQLLGEYEGY